MEIIRILAEKTPMGLHIRQMSLLQCLISLESFWCFYNHWSAKARNSTHPLFPLTLFRNQIQNLPYLRILKMGILIIQLCTKISYGINKICHCFSPSRRISGISRHTRYPSTHLFSLHIKAFCIFL